MKKLLLAALLLASGAAHAQLYSKFGPVTGVLKGNVSTPQTSAAASSDIIGLWSGCTGSNFLRGDGTCTTPAGTGVTSVAQTVPAGFSVTGSPVTSTGTLAIGYATGQTANRVLATPDGTTGALSLRALVAGDIPPINLGSTANGGVSSATILLGTNGGTSNAFFSVTGPATALRTFTFPNASATVLTDNALVTVAQGGTGVGTLTGLVKGNGTSAFTAATSANVISLWTGTCNSTTFLRGDGACTTTGAGGSPGGANTNIQFNNSGVFGGDSGFTYAGSGGTVTLSGATPNTVFNATGAGSDQKNWRQVATSTDFIGDTRTDAGGAGRNWLDVTRGTGVAISAINLGNATDNPPVTLLGTGGLTVGVPAGNSQSINIKGSGVGTANVGVVAFVDSGGTRTGYIGDSSSGDANVSLECDTSPCNINLLPGGTGLVSVGGAGNNSIRTNGGSNSQTTGSAVGVFNIPAVTATYLAVCQLAAGGSAVSLITGGTGNAPTPTTLSTNGQVALTISGVGINCTQTTGSTATVFWSILRFGN
jgi:hypothetical protein